MLMTLLTLLSPAVPVSGPTYDTPETKTIVEAMVEAHGGMEAWDRITQLRYRFFTRNSGAPEPWLSWERVETGTGRALIEWPVFGAVVGYDGEEVWSTNWPLPFSPGFFTNLTYSFITAPFQTQRDGVHLGPVERKRLPNDSTDYFAVRMTMDHPRGSLPGTFFRLYIDPASHLLRAIEFDIAHPGLVANPNQPLGPNIHVFDDYKPAGGVILPRFYSTFGFNARNQNRSNATHYVFDLAVDQPFDPAVTRRPAEAVVDTVTGRFWRR